MIYPNNLFHRSHELQSHRGRIPWLGLRWPFSARKVVSWWFRPDAKDATSTGRSLRWVLLEILLHGWTLKILCFQAQNVNHQITFWRHLRLMKRYDPPGNNSHVLVVDKSLLELTQFQLWIWYICTCEWDVCA